MHLQHTPGGWQSLALRISGLLSGLALAGFAQAADGAPRPSWSLSGFGSVGLVHSSYAQADYTSTILKAHGAGYSSRWSNDLDTRLGAQLNVNPNKQWSAVLQVISEQGIDNSYRPIVEWGNVKYQATPELALRVGRIALPMLLAADYRKVGYAYPWVRTPVEVYGAIPIANSDGVDTTYRWSHGSVKNVTQVFYGRTNLKQAKVQARGLVGASHTVEYGAASARISALSTDLTVDLGRDLFDGLRQFGPQGAALADRYVVDHKQARAISIGASYDSGSWFAMGEMGRMRSNSFLGDTTALYASSGYRLGNFTPYLAFARVSANSPTSEPGLKLPGLPAPAAALGNKLNGSLNWLLTTIPVQHTASIGTRWDCRQDFALKLQVDRVTPTGGSRGTFINVQPGFRSGTSVNVASAVLDFVF